jgi:hypothetical protein
VYNVTGLVVVNPAPLIPTISGGSVQVWNVRQLNTLTVTVADPDSAGTYIYTWCIIAPPNPNCVVYSLNSAVLSVSANYFRTNSDPTYGYTITVLVYDASNLSRVGVYSTKIIPTYSNPEYTLRIGSTLGDNVIVPPGKPVTLFGTVVGRSGEPVSPSTFFWSNSPLNTVPLTLSNDITKYSYFIPAGTLPEATVSALSLTVGVGNPPVILTSTIQLKTATRLQSCSLSVINDNSLMMTNNDPSSGRALLDTFTMRVQNCGGGVPPYSYTYSYKSTNVHGRITTYYLQIKSMISIMMEVRFPVGASQVQVEVTDQVGSAITLTLNLNLRTTLSIADVLDQCQSTYNYILTQRTVNSAQALDKTQYALKLCDPTRFSVGSDATQNQIDSLTTLNNQIIRILAELLPMQTSLDPATVATGLTAYSMVDVSQFTSLEISNQLNYIGNAVAAISGLLSDELVLNLILTVGDMLEVFFEALTTLKQRQASSDVPAQVILIIRQILIALIQTDTCSLTGVPRTIVTEWVTADIYRAVLNELTTDLDSRRVSNFTIGLPTLPQGCYDIQAIEWAKYRGNDDPSQNLLSNVLTLDVFTNNTLVNPFLFTSTLNFVVTPTKSIPVNHTVTCVQRRFSGWSSIGCSVISIFADAVACACSFASSGEYAIQAKSIPATATPTPSQTPIIDVLSRNDTGAIVGGIISGLAAFGLIVLIYIRRKKLP